MHNYVHVFMLAEEKKIQNNMFVNNGRYMDLISVQFSNIRSLPSKSVQ